MYFVNPRRLEEPWEAFGVTGNMLDKPHTAEVVLMSPRAFLEKVYPGGRVRFDDFQVGPGERSFDWIRAASYAGRPFVPLELWDFIDSYNDPETGEVFNVRQHEGRHRAVVASYLGMKAVPVILWRKHLYDKYNGAPYGIQLKAKRKALKDWDRVVKRANQINEKVYVENNPTKKYEQRITRGMRYFYHTTSIDNLAAIQSEGLTPRTGRRNITGGTGFRRHTRNRIFFASAISALNWYWQVPFDNKVLLRIPVKSVDGIHRDRLGGEGDSFYTYSSVAPDQIQMWLNGTWRFILDIDTAGLLDEIEHGYDLTTAFEPSRSTFKKSVGEEYHASQQAYITPKRKIRRRTKKTEKAKWLPRAKRNPGKSYEQRAIDEYGLTDNWREAGFILKDGSLLDFGRSQGETDHITVAYYVIGKLGRLRDENFDRVPAYERWIKVTGAVRLTPELPGFTIFTRPTKEQLRVMRQIAETAKYKDPNTRVFGADFKAKDASFWGAIYEWYEWSKFMRDLNRYFSDVKRNPEVIPTGECYYYAANFFLDNIDKFNNIALIHGLILHPGTTDHYIRHGWVEADGRVYDWQSYVGLWEDLGLKNTVEPFTLDEYQETFAPTKQASWTSDLEVMGLMGRTRHWGAWVTEEDLTPKEINWDEEDLF